MQGFGTYTPIKTTVGAASGGGPGAITINVTGALSLHSGAEISSDSFNPSAPRNPNAPPTIKVHADTIEIDGEGLDRWGPRTGIFTTAGAGDGGPVTVDVNRSLSVLGNAQIHSDTIGTGNAGAIHVSADSIVIDGQGLAFLPTGIFSNAAAGKGNAGDVEVKAKGNVTLLDWGRISSDTASAGNAGRVHVQAKAISIDGRGDDRTHIGTGIVIVTGIFSNADFGSSGNAGAVQLQISDSLLVRVGGSITAFSQDAGDSGTISIQAGSITMEGEGLRTSIHTSLQRESPRLCRGGSKSLTDTGVHQGNS
jgi:hypothetical protein